MQVSFCIIFKICLSICCLLLPQECGICLFISFFFVFYPCNFSVLHEAQHFCFCRCCFWCCWCFHPYRVLWLSQIGDVVVFWFQSFVKLENVDATTFLPAAASGNLCMLSRNHTVRHTTVFRLQRPPSSRESVFLGCLVWLLATRSTLDFVVINGSD